MELTSQQQTVPKLRFPEFMGAWERHKLGEYYTFKNGVNAEKGMYGHGRKFINVLDIISDGPITSEKIIGSVSISDAVFENYKVVYGDILFQRSSETREEVGQSNVYLDKDTPATFGGFVIRGHPKKKIDPEYVDSLLKTAKVRKDMTARSGGSTRYNVGQESLSQVTIHVAPTAQEQEKVAAFLGAVDRKIGQLERKKEYLEAYKKGCMQKLFSQELRFKDDQGRDFPNWEEKELAEVAKINPRSRNLPCNFEYIDLESVVGGRLIGTQHLSRENAPSRAQRLLAKGDIIFQLVRPYQRNNLHFRCNGEFVASTGYAQMRANEHAGFLFQLLHTDGFVNNVLRRSTGSNYPAINSNDLATIQVVVPHPDEQRKIADFLSALDKKIALVEQELGYARIFKKGLLQKMFV